MKRKRILLALLIVIILPQILTSEPQTDNLKNQITLIIRILRSDDPETLNEARNLLLDMGEDAREQLLMAAESSDEELAEPARGVLKELCQARLGLKIVGPDGKTARRKKGTRKTEFPPRQGRGRHLGPV